jgi:8-hydroxy-5-deazaflavin:NADPH oxidoreductase
MRIGVLGGTGPAGRGLAARLASVGYEVVIGSRSVERGEETCAALREAWPDFDLAVKGGTNADAAAADAVVVATPWDGAVPTACAVGDQLEGKLVISMANALVRIGTEFQPLVPPRGSVAAALQAALPASYVSGALHHVPAKELAAIDHPVDIDILVCSDHPAATEQTCELIHAMPNMRALDAGPLSTAAPIESFTAVLLQLNTHYKTRAGLKITGIDA